ncbi:MAG: hypothetical protein ACLPX8_19850 [Bryobacteraceae bacterium]
MEAMGGRGFTPMPPDQHKWQASPREPVLHRIWSWMCDHTINWGHDSPYAVSSDKDELGLVHMAKDLGVELNNLTNYWRMGEERGLWRKGSKLEGERRLYLNARVPEVHNKQGEQKGNKSVCTYDLPPKVLLWLNNLPEEVRRKVVSERLRDLQVQDDAIAEMTAAVREAWSTHVEDIRFREWAQLGVPHKERQGPKPRGTPAQIQARRSRLADVIPTVRSYVQTVSASVQTAEFDMHNHENVDVQTGATLLPQTRPERQNLERAESLDAPQSHPEPHPAVDGREPNAHYASEKADSSGSENENTENPENRQLEKEEGYETLWSGIEGIQISFPRSTFGEVTVDRTNRGDHVTMRQIYDAIGRTEGAAQQFRLFCVGKIRAMPGVGAAAREGRMPARGPKSLGLILEWAKDWGRAHGVPQRGPGWDRPAKSKTKGATA